MYHHTWYHNLHITLVQINTMIIKKLVIFHFEV